MKEKTLSLLPLRIHSWWGVMYNSLYDVRPVIENGVVLNAQLFPEVLLHVQKISSLFGGKVMREYRYADEVELAIHFEVRDGKPMYLLKVHECSDPAGKYVAQFESNNLHEVLDTFHFWMECLSTPWMHENIHSLASLTPEMTEGRSGLKPAYSAYTDNAPQKMSFRIPSGWAMATNNVFEWDPLIIDGEFKNKLYFAEDLLMLCRLVDGKLPAEGRVYIDADWFPQEQDDGKYQLRLSWDMSIDDMYTVTCPSWQELQAKVNEWLQVLSDGAGTHEQIRKIIHGDSTTFTRLLNLNL